MSDVDAPLVLCLMCRRPCKSDVSRARRIGSGCWRKLRRADHGQAAALPGLETTYVPGVSF